LFDVRGLSFTYPRSAAPALKNVSLTLSEAEVTAIVGENGAGKSTLARLFAGILRPAPRTICLRGRDVRTLRLPEIARQVGYVFQYPEHQFVGHTVLDDVAYGLRRAGLSDAEARQRASAMLDEFG